MVIQTEANALLNENVLLNCSVESELPIIDICWIKDGTRVNSSMNDRYTGGTKDEPTLKIVQSLKTDSGNYKCVAVNIAGSNESLLITVTVGCDSCKFWFRR